VRGPGAGLHPGEIVRGRYEVDVALGAGRLGSVVKAIDTDNGAEVALKVIHRALIPDEEAGRRFLRSVRPLIKSAHPFMNRVLDVNCEGDKYYVVYAFIEGIPLRRLMEGRRVQGQCFTLDEFFPIIKQVAQFFAESDVGVHGSISPENLWIQPQHIKLLDVGLAAALPPTGVAYRLRSDERVRGYVAPELIRGRAPDERSDIYALGVLLGEMLTQVHYDGRSEMFQQADPDLPAEIDSVLRRALLGDPRGRHAHAGELLETIAELAGLPVPAFAEPSSLREPDGEPLDLDEPSQPAAKLSAADFGLGHVEADTTVQVSMADVIRAHAEGGKGAAEEAPVPLVRPSTPPPPPDRSSSTPPPAHRSSTTPPPPSDRSSTIPPAARTSAPKPRRRLTAPPPRGRRPSVPPPARRPSVPPPVRRSSVPPPRAAAHDEQPARVGAPPMVQAPPRIEPRRPSPLRRDTVPPPPLRPVAPPPVGQRVDSEPVLGDDDDTAVHRVRPSAPVAPLPRREVTQEIDLDEVETLDGGTERREVTQEVDVGMIESVQQSSMSEAVRKLEDQANAAETASAEELIRRAEGLDGVDPRLVRAAHTLESDRRGARSRRAAEMLKERASNLDGIDPRFLRAAARLEEAKIKDVSSVGAPPAPDPEPEPEPEPATEVEGTTDDDDWRARLATSEEDSVISFLAPPVVERSSEVQGFPRSVQRRQQPRPPDAQPPPPAPPKGSRRRKP
jgi:serine/threonine protein kinase